MNNEVEELEVITIVKKIKYKGVVWVPENIDKTDDVPKPRNIKKLYILKWIEQLKVGDVFTLDQFYYNYPKIKNSSNGRKRVDKVIVDLIKEGKINHWKHKDEFRVLK